MASNGESSETQTVEKAFAGQIIAKDADRQIVTAPALIPDTPDRHGDVVEKDNIEEVAHEWLEQYGHVDHMHTFEEVGTPVESYLAPQDLTFDLEGTSKSVPEGTWMLSVRVQDDEIWQQVKDGEITGFSIYGEGRRPDADSPDSEGGAA